MDFEWYVLNYNFNEKKVKMFNIFSNGSLNTATEKLIKKYLSAPKKFSSKDVYNNNSIVTGFEAFSKELERLIMWQEWARIEYEISVGKPFEEDPKNLEKWDCYRQCVPNIPMIAREVLWQYKNNLKKS